MPDLVCKLTPPPKGSAVSRLSPTSFLTSEETISSIKRKSNFQHISSGIRKRLRLDPSTIDEDVDISMYHERTQSMLPVDRVQLHVLIPFEEELERVKDTVKSLESSVESLQSEPGKTKHELEKTQQRRLSMLCANSLIELARNAAKKYKPDLGGARLQQFVTHVTDAQLRELEVPSKFWKQLRKLNNIVAARSEQAHETAGEFAELLLHKDSRGGEIYKFWKDIFPWYTGQRWRKLLREGGGERQYALWFCMIKHQQS